MSHTITVLSIPKPAVPRGALLAAAVYRWIAERHQAWRAARAERRAADEAAAVRAMALHVQATDPGFAADLYAAADRHQGGR